MTISPWKQMPGPEFYLGPTEEIDLSGSAVTLPIVPANAYPISFGNSQTSVTLVVTKLLIMYTEATPGSTDATYNFLVRLGTNANSSACHDYTIPASKSVGDVDIIEAADFSADARLFNSVNWLQIYCPGGASGAGKVRVGVMVSQDYRKWSGYDGT